MPSLKSAHSKTLITLPLKLIGWIALYCLIADISGGLQTDLGNFIFEIPFIVLIGCLTYAATNPQTKLRSLVAILPVFAYYLFTDIYYAKMGRVFKWVEVSDLHLMFDVMPFMGKLVLILIPIGAVILLSTQYRWRGWLHGSVLLLCLGLPLISAIALPKQFSETFERYARKLYIDEKASVTQNGRLVTPLYFEAKRRLAIKQLSHTKNWAHERNNSLTSWFNGAEKNIHIIVMESWLDPTLFKNIKTDANLSLDNQYPDLFRKNFSISPVFGGQTPQAEFEILCGTPAMQVVGTIEFNYFSGSQTSCLPNWLNNANWITIASHAHKPTFFNRANAYTSLGFSDINFPADYSADDATYIRNGLVKNEPYMFDGDILQENLIYLEQQLQHGRPIFNYVLGVYGHWPHQLTEPRFNNRFNIDAGENSKQLNLIASQYYYRGLALKDYLDKLKTLDPTALVLVISDHLPPFPRDTNWDKNLGYFEESNQGKYLNIFYAWNESQPISIAEPLHHYEFIELIMNKLLGSCPQEICNEHKEANYENIVSSAIH